MTHTLPADLVSYLLIGTWAFLVIHWLRRAILKPAGPSTTDPNASGSAGFDRFQILFHWATLVALLVTIASGLALYYPAVLEPAAMAVGFPIHTNFRLLVDVHVASVVAFALLIAAHIAWDVFKVKGSRLVIPGPNDIRQSAVRVGSFVRGGEILRGGKYDVFMKSFHILLTINSIILAVTGSTLYFFAPWWLVPQLSHPAVEPWWKPTILHDLFGFSLVVLLTAHTYFALLRVNRPLLRAMFRPRAGAPVNRIIDKATIARSPVARTASPGPSARGMSRFANRLLRRDTCNDKNG